MSAGIKRPRENFPEDLPYGSDSDRSNARRDVRRRDEGGPRDWRDAHLTTGRSHRDSSSSRNYDRNSDRDGGRRHYGDGGQHLSSKHTPPRYDDRRHNNKRDKYPSHGSSRGKAPDRERTSSYRRDQPGGDHRSRRSPPSRNSSNPSRELSQGPSVGKEEGEISPRMSHLAISSAPPTPRDVELKRDKGIASGPIDMEEEPEEEEDEELTAEQIIAARRARRQAILEQYAAETQKKSTLSAVTGDEVPSSATPAGSAPSSGIPQHVAPRSNGLSYGPPAKGAVEAIGEPQEPGLGTPEETPAQGGFSLTKGIEGGIAEAVGKPPLEQVSAADYDPNQDRLEEEQRRIKAQGKDEKMDIDEVVEEEEEVEEEDDDDLDDMFAIMDDLPKKKVRRVKRRGAVPVRAATNVDSAADPEGYYQIILGELLDSGRYQVFSSLGKGMFSAVVRARILIGDKDEIGREVAIKIIRSQESMYKAGLKEVAILNKLMTTDPEDKKHMIRLEKTFEHRGHLCLVFESLSMNLREIVKRFGKDVGLSMSAVRAYAQQMLLALTLLKKCNVMHADIKPDNILVSENRAMLKVCDLGSASDVSENDIAPYLVSRFYRAPEIILGLPYDTSLDMWSVGCTLFELYTGKILFPGRSNNHMLLLMMELKGRFNTKMVKRAKFGDVHFDDRGAFLSVELDKITGSNMTRTVFVQKPARDLRARLVPPSVAKANDDESKTLLAFVDLLDKCLTLDPAKRLTARDALMHPFIRGNV